MKMTDDPEQTCFSPVAAVAMKSSVMRFDFGDGQGLVPFSFHANGGGKVALTASVEDTVYVGSGCLVYGYAQIKGEVRLEGRVRVDGEKYPNEVSTLIEDRVRLSGQAHVSGCVILRDDAHVGEQAVLKGCVEVLHHACVGGKAKIEGWVSLCDRSIVRGNAHLKGTLEPLVLRHNAYLEEGYITSSQGLSIAIRKQKLLVVKAPSIKPSKPKKGA